VLGAVALAETTILKVNTSLEPAPTEAAEGDVTVRSVEDDVMLGVTVRASWPEFATVI